MDFLKDILGDDLFKQVETAVNAYNGNEANKDKQIKLANLGTGDYVGKGKFEALQALIDGKDKEIATANGLIADLKKGTKDNESLQGKITEYESTINQLKEQLAQEKVNNAIKVALMESHVSDIDYMTFKLKEKGESIELDDAGNIKGWSDIISGLKTQFPSMFGAEESKRFEPNKLDEGNGNNSVSKAEFDKMGYADRLKLFNENPDAYAELTK